MASDEGTGSEIEHQTAIHLTVEVEIEVIEGLLRVSELGLFFFLRSSSRSPRRVSSSETRQERKSIGGMASA